MKHFVIVGAREREQGAALGAAARGFGTRSGWPAARALQLDGPTRRELLVWGAGEEDVLEGFRVGADDYVAKPCSPKVLGARMQAILRRAGEAEAHRGEPRLEIGDLALDPEAQEAMTARYMTVARQVATRRGIAVLVTHRMSMPMLADRIIVLHDGELVEAGVRLSGGAAAAGTAGAGAGLPAAGEPQHGDRGQDEAEESLGPHEHLLGRGVDRRVSDDSRVGGHGCAASQARGIRGPAVTLGSDNAMFPRRPHAEINRGVTERFMSFP